jgi:hypothetical protein
MARARPFDEGGTIEILHHRMNGLGPVEIGARLHRTESTIQSLLKSYEKSRAIFPRRGRPPLPPIPNSMIDHITGQLDREPTVALRTQRKTLAEFANLCKTRLWKLRRQQGYHFSKENEICNVTLELNSS